MSRAAINGTEFDAPEFVATVSNPSAGANWSYTVPTGSRWQLESAKYIVTCDANAANRVMRLRLRRGANTLWELPPSAVVTANNQATQYWAKGLVSATTTSSAQTMALPLYPTLLPGDIIDSVIASIQVGDQASGIVLVFSQV